MGNAPTLRLPCLVVVRGRERGRIIPIGRDGVTLGRASKTGIRVLDRGVSRRHARFSVVRGEVSLQDLKSTNGTWRNGRRVKQATLKNGDQLQFGACIATFRHSQSDRRRLRQELGFLTGSDITRIIRIIRIIAEALESAQEIDNHNRTGSV